MTNYRSVILLLLYAMFALSVAYAEDGGYSQVDPIVRTADAAWVGESTLLRFSNRVQAVVRTSDLDPGAAMTAWWRIYNRPQHCAVPYACEASDLTNPRVMGSQLHATGFVAANADGTATIVASLYRMAPRAEGGQPMADSFEEGHLSGRGLRRPMHAEVELLFASHGQLADPDVTGKPAALEQLLTPFGTQLECAGPQMPAAGRTYRCGVLQRVDHAPAN